jgi:hypothetical protein
MFEGASEFAIAADLRQTRERLTIARHRLVDTVALAPRPDASGWSGPAGWAYQHALAALARELEAALELLRSAADLTAAALYEVGQGD